MLAAARRLGYTPNAIARSLITQQTGIVALEMAISPLSGSRSTR